MEGDDIIRLIERRSVSFSLEKPGVRTVVDGIGTYGAPTVSAELAVIQDAEAIDLKSLPEGSHNKAVIAVWALNSVPLEIKDIVNYLGERYVIHFLHNKWTTHRKALAIGVVS